MVSSLLIKPAGPDCNLRCNYCFYRQKAGMFDGKIHRMSDDVIDTLIRDAMQSGIRVFSWQGGEPTLMGLDFFKKAVGYQMAYGNPGDMVANALQTNGTLLDRNWAKFLADYKFLVGLSIDGPETTHDAYRKDASGKGTFKQIMHNAGILGESGVEFNVLSLVNDINVKKPERVYDYFVRSGFTYLQFIPCIEPGMPKFSVNPKDYGEFLVRIFDKWAADFPKISIREYDALVLMELGRSPGMCTFDKRCGDYVVVEHNGDVFACDFFVNQDWYLGNIMETPLHDIIKSPKLEDFAGRKMAISQRCSACEYMSICYGGCPKHRLMNGREVDSPSYLCPAYKRLFEHSRPVVRKLAEIVRNG